MVMENSQTQAMIFNCVIKNEGSLWVGHCLELDIVATADSMESVKDDLKDLILVQVDYAFSNDNLENLYRPAPSEVWQEFYRCRTMSEDRVPLVPAYQPDENLTAFVPPWIIQKTCLAENACSA